MEGSFVVDERYLNIAVVCFTANGEGSRPGKRGDKGRSEEQRREAEE